MRYTRVYILIFVYKNKDNIIQLQFLER